MENVEKAGDVLLVLCKTAEESTGAFILCIAENFLRTALLDDDAAVHKDNTVGHVAGECHFMCDDDHGHVFLGELTDNTKNFTGQLRVERRGRLVKKQYAWIERGLGASVRAMATRCCCPPDS